MKIVYAAKRAICEFRDIMAGKPSSHKRMQHFRSQAKGSHESFKYVQKLMFQYRAELEANDIPLPPKAKD